ncbi:MAG TPA: polysaccharide export protein EpsE, partial [Blastocatellia bacterium]|nr:polysaccharide export protein EpsE [Blastocatellia bacterium]
MVTFRLWLTLAVLFLAVGAPLPARAQEKPSEYQLGPGDMIRVLVFQHPDLTLETRVSESGAISYPLIGSVRIGGMTIGAGEQAISRALRDGGFIKQPRVNILLLQSRGNQVSVLGQVGKPGRYPLEASNTKLSEMLAIAGGVAPSGADIAIVTGMRDGNPFRRDVDIAALFLKNSAQEDIVISGGDVIFVNRAPTYYIYGEVQKPGSYRVERGMTVRQALAQGGGLTGRGTERGLRLYRRGANGNVETLTPSPDDLVQADDVFHVRESL